MRRPTHRSSKREENIFLALKIGVEGAARVAGKRGDIFQTGGLKSVAGEDPLRGDQKLPPGRVRASLLPRKRSL